MGSEIAGEGYCRFGGGGGGGLGGGGGGVGGGGLWGGGGGGGGDWGWMWMEVGIGDATQEFNGEDGDGDEGLEWSKADEMMDSMPKLVRSIPTDIQEDELGRTY